MMRSIFLTLSILVLWMGTEARTEGLKTAAPHRTTLIDPWLIPEPELVMSKNYSLRNEVGVQLGYLPVGAFNKYLEFGLEASVFFNQHHGWEVFNYIYAYELEQKLKKELKNSWGATDASLPKMNYMLTSSYIYSPFYTKSLAFNKYIVHSQLSFLAGGGVASYTSESVPTASLGIVERFFRNQDSSLRFDFRYYHFFPKDFKEVIRNQVSITVGYSFHFGGTPK